MRDELWLMAIKKAKTSGAVMQIWADQNPQGFSYRQYGAPERGFVDLEGVSLIQIKRRLTTVDDEATAKNADTAEG